METNYFLENLGWSRYFIVLVLGDTNKIFVLPTTYYTSSDYTQHILEYIE